MADIINLDDYREPEPFTFHEDEYFVWCMESTPTKFEEKEGFFVFTYGEEDQSD